MKLIIKLKYIIILHYIILNKKRKITNVFHNNCIIIYVQCIHGITENKFINLICDYNTRVLSSWNRLLKY